MQQSASAYERHQAILDLVQRYESIRVNELAEQLDVSESTIRTDLETLHEQGRLVRVRGGAIAKESKTGNGASALLSDKAQKNADEKQLIARWAAGMIEDGDVIMLDASSTVLHIAPFLHDRRNLTVFTNGIQVAQALAKETSNTVILLGGILRPNGNAITGEISKQLLQDYHVKTAFVSCSGYSPSHGFFEMDMREAQMKTIMLQAAQEKVALLDSSKIGNIGLTTFASPDYFDYLVTDEGIERKTIHEIRTTKTHLIVCGEQTSQTYVPNDKVNQAKKYRIGFANLSENTAFSRDVRRSLEKAAEESQEIELIVADNQLDPQIALQVADELLSQNLDLVIEYQIDEAIGNLIAYKFQQAKVPVIAVDIPMLGAVYFGVNNYVAGKLAGLELGKSIQKHWKGDLEHLIIVEQARAGSLPAMRIQGQVDGVFEVLPQISKEKIIHVDCDNTSEGTYAVMKTVFESLSSKARVAVISFNDDAALGTVYAAQDTQRSDKLLLVGQGADRRLRAEMRKTDSPVIGATAYRPEDYGKYLIQVALDILEGKQVAPAVYMQHDFITPQNVDKFYTHEDIL